MLAALVGDLARTSLLRALEVATRVFLNQLRRGEPGLADRLAQPLLAFVQASLDEGAQDSRSGQRG